jgi:prolyl 4-hydroxylase
VSPMDQERQSERSGAALGVNVLHARHAVMTVSGVLGAKDCDALIGFAEAIGFTAAPITTAFGPVMAPDIRDNTRVMIDDPARAAELWRILAPVVPVRIGDWTSVGLNERLRFYRYDRTQRFAWHRDGAFVRNGMERSQLTVLLYLNADFEGGATEIDVDEPINVKPERGSALLFVHHLRHQGAPITRGRKYVLRTDVMYRHD